MGSEFQDTNLSEIAWDDLTKEQLQDIAQNDERSTAQEKAAALLDERSAPAPAVTLDQYNPREDKGPKRIEDTDAEGARDPDVYADVKEVPLEDSVKNHTTILATDTFDSAGNVTNREAKEAPQTS